MEPDRRRQINSRALGIAPLDYALSRGIVNVGANNRIYKEAKPGSRRRVGSSTQKAPVLIKQIELAVAAITGAGIAHFGVAQVRQRIDDHLSNLVAENVSIDLFGCPVIDRVIVVGDRQILSKHEAVAVWCSIARSRMIGVAVTRVRWSGRE